MKKYSIPLLFLFGIAVAVSCQKSPNETDEIMPDGWRSPSCSPENSLLISQMTVKESDTTIFDFSYDNQYRLIEEKSRIPMRGVTKIDYLDNGNYLVSTLKLDGTVLNRGVVYLNELRRMDSVIIFLKNDSLPNQKNWYYYNTENKRMGYHCYFINNRPLGVEDDLYLSAEYEWGDYNVTRSKIIQGDDANVTQNNSLEYFNDYKSYLYPYIEPKSGFSFRSSFSEDVNAGMMSKNLVKKKISQGGEYSEYSPTFDIGDRLIKNTETTYDAAGNKTGTTYRYFRYRCK